ncbi:hypothetical protein M8C21_020777 [Ambrosia artemisiifolia]|uniref:Uncharacterized protein n=1 Tax=Ambrosia artemisiifolia TaxID=4212 RepID=A0AAD5GKA6_AMBAR|nr:hypothetical protein M8C21_020777 [Ambrosia artemisiifolia]
MARPKNQSTNHKMELFWSVHGSDRNREPFRPVIDLVYRVFCFPCKSPTSLESGPLLVSLASFCAFYQLALPALFKDMANSSDLVSSEICPPSVSLLGLLRCLDYSSYSAWNWFLTAGTPCICLSHYCYGSDRGNMDHLPVCCSGFNIIVLISVTALIPLMLLTCCHFSSIHEVQTCRSSRDVSRRDDTIILLKKELETALESLNGVKTEMARLGSE